VLPSVVVLALVALGGLVAVGGLYVAGRTLPAVRISLRDSALRTHRLRVWGDERERFFRNRSSLAGAIRRVGGGGGATSRKLVGGRLPADAELEAFEAVEAVEAFKPDVIAPSVEAGD
jgi:hypothetical protein